MLNRKSKEIERLDTIIEMLRKLYINQKNRCDELSNTIREVTDQNANSRIENEYSVGVKEILQDLDNLMNEDVKSVVHAEWKKDKEVYICSNCGVAVSYVYPKEWISCPYCGADMRGVDNG